MPKMPKSKKTLMQGGKSREDDEKKTAMGKKGK